jgi:hypothetical protein
MKKFIPLFLFLLIFGKSDAQCDINNFGSSYYNSPGFLTLYLTGQCISGQIGDTVICVKYPRLNSTQFAFFSYSSPTGQPAFITDISQYNSYCEFIGNGTQIAAGEDTVTVCYTIRAELIDNFCPYALRSIPLAVDFCGIYAYWENEILNVRWVTCSNSNTDKFQVIISNDTFNWTPLIEVNAKSITSSQAIDYNYHIPFSRGGIHYVAVREIDFNGQITVSSVAYFEAPHVINNKPVGYDLLGRKTNDKGFLYYVQPR